MCFRQVRYEAVCTQSPRDGSKYVSFLFYIHASGDSVPATQCHVTLSSVTLTWTTLSIGFADKDLIIPEDLEKPIADALFAVLSHKGSEDEEQRRREEERHELHITEVALMQSLELHRKGEHLSDGKIETLDCGSSSSSSSSSGGGGGGSSSSSDLGNKNKKHEWPDMEVMVDELVNDDEKDTEKGKGKGKARLGEEAIPQKNNRNDYPVRGRVIRTPSERRQEEMMSSREEEWSCQYCESLNEGEKGDKSAECNLCGVLRGSLGSIVSESRLPPEGQEGIYASAAPVSSLQQSQEFLHASFFKLMFPMFRQEDLEQVIRGKLAACQWIVSETSWRYASLKI